jgi:hypothetical protein
MVEAARAEGGQATARGDGTSGVWLATGGAAAIALGVILIPLRTVTSASNLAFAFVLLTVVVAEVGGRGAGLFTAVVSALSLNFFLTEPYLTMVIHRPDDVVAFVGLAVCGLVAAAFGRRRAWTAERATVVRQDLDAVERVAEGLAGGKPLADVLEGLRRAFRLGGLVLRGADGRPIAAAPPGYGARAAPSARLDPRSLLATGEAVTRIGRRGLRLPDDGGQLPVGPGPRAISLDLWEGDPDGLSVDDCRALAVAAVLLGLARQGSPEAEAGPSREPPGGA